MRFSDAGAPSPPEPDPVTDVSAEAERCWAEQDARARAGRRRLWLIGGAFAALFLGAFAVLVYSDIEAPDLSDLELKPLALAEADNAYLALVKFGGELSAAPVVAADEPDSPPVPGAESESQSSAAQTDGQTEPDADAGLFDAYDYGQAPDPLRERLQRGEDWTSERVAKWVPALHGVALRLREIADMPTAQGSRPQSYQDRSNAAELHEAFVHGRLAAWAQWRAGEHERAFATAIAGWRCARMLRDARGPLIDYMTGVSGMDMFETTLRELAARPEAPAAALREVLTALPAAAETERDGFADSAKVEALLMAGALREHTAKDAVNWADSSGLLKLCARSRVLFPLVYKPNLSIAQHADLVRWRLGTMHWRMAELDTHPTSAGRCPHCEGLAGMEWWRLYNQHGRMLTVMLSPLMDSRMRRRLVNFSRTSLTRAYLALRLWHLEHGELPERLDQLVPGYLAEVPLDHVDKTPLRYSRELAAIWTAGGTDLVVTSRDQTFAGVESEWVCWLTFAEPAEARPVRAGP